MLTTEYGKIVVGHNKQPLHVAGRAAVSISTPSAVILYNENREGAGGYLMNRPEDRESLYEQQCFLKLSTSFAIHRDSSPIVWPVVDLVAFPKIDHLHKSVFDS